MAKGKCSEQQLAEMGVEVLRSLKNKGLRIKDVRAILRHAEIAIDYIEFGEDYSAED